MGDKERRHATILRLVRKGTVTSQRQLRSLLAEAGIRVTQATLSRDVRELRLAKAPDAGGTGRYVQQEEADTIPSLVRLLPALFLSAEGTGNLLVVRTMTGSASSVALALDREGWPEVLGTIAGDDTILVICRDAGQVADVSGRLEELAAGSGL